MLYQYRDRGMIWWLMTNHGTTFLGTSWLKPPEAKLSHQPLTLLIYGYLRSTLLPLSSIRWWYIPWNQTNHSVLLPPSSIGIGLWHGLLKSYIHTSLHAICIHTSLLWDDDGRRLSFARSVCAVLLWDSPVGFLLWGSSVRKLKPISPLVREDHLRVVTTCTFTLKSLWTMMTWCVQSFLLLDGFFSVKWSVERAVIPIAWGVLLKEFDNQATFSSGRNHHSVHNSSKSFYQSITYRFLELWWHEMSSIKCCPFRSMMLIYSIEREVRSVCIIDLVWIPFSQGSLFWERWQTRLVLRYDLLNVR